MTRANSRERENGDEPARQAAGAAPPDALVAHWVATGLVPAGAAWAPLAGGRTNALWQIVPDAEVARASGPEAAPAAPPLVCKLYRPGSGTPLFANDAGAERRALAALAGTGLAPPLVAAGETPAGPSLVYGHVAGRPWQAGDDPAPVARALGRLHALAPPPGLPEAETGPAALARQAEEMIAALGAEDADAKALAALRPALPDLPVAAPRAFLHGDATAGNVLVTAAGITFIDWQCPARGDAAEDLATFLSPAMQAMSGNAPLSPQVVAAFLAAYPEQGAAARLRALAPLFHWRMAAYCLWRAARGEPGYRAAAELEIAALRSARQAR